jgi:hypothetical protein
MSGGVQYGGCWKIQFTIRFRSALPGQEGKMLKINLGIILFIVAVPGIAAAADFYIPRSGSDRVRRLIKKGY